VKGARIGATLGFILNSQFYNIAVNPVPMMYVSANQSLLDKFSRTVFRPQLQMSGLQNRIKASVDNKKNKNKSTGDTASLIEFGDSYLYFMGANSASNFRQIAVQYLYKDEEASYKIDKHEGNISDLADSRTLDFGMYAKRFGISTPVNEGDAFCKNYDAGDCSEWHVPCPLCGGMQQLEFAKFEKDHNGEDKKLLYGLVFEHENYMLKSPSINYKCKHCHEIFPEDEKYKINLGGAWIPQRKTFTSEIRSFKASALVSNFFEWQDAVEKFLKAKRGGKPSDYRGFVNTVLGEPFKLKTNKINLDILKRKVAGYSRGEVPAEVGFLTCAIDVQGDRLEYEVKGWGKNKESFSIDYGKIMGDTNGHEIWNKLEEFCLYERWAGMRPLMFVIDSGDGSKNKENQNKNVVVQDVCRMINRKNIEITEEKTIIIVPLKGQSPKQINTLQYRDVFIDDFLFRLNINTYHYKEEFYAHITQEYDPKKDESKPHNFYNFPNDYPKTYYAMLNSEEQVKDTDASGYTKTSWVKTKSRNEALDLTCYNSALCDFLLESFFKATWEAIMKDSFEAGEPIELIEYNHKYNFLLAKRFEK